ncbi:hypothetical protein [uncultured Comamonas sp.]|uniref:hypothetical protein n=1 Tax=uncultured Comamonas sp. TaxID=114710 RepID=UPI00374A1470
MPERRIAQWGDVSIQRPLMGQHHGSRAMMAPQTWVLASPSRIRLLLACWVGLTTVLGLVWMHVAAPSAWQRALAVAVLVLAMAIACRMPLWREGTCLCWTGSQWCLGQGPLASAHRQALAQLAVLMDGQSWILLQAWPLQNDGRSQWLLVVKASNPERWPDIRRVLYSSLAAEPQNIHQV